MRKEISDADRSFGHFMQVTHHLADRFSHFPKSLIEQASSNAGSPVGEA
jgi:hypothetical protein